jgi:L-rhamnose-H+ transport protein
MQGGFVLPMKYLRGWKWENGWFVYTVVNCLIFPIALLVWSVPSFLDIYRQTSATTLLLTFGFGFGWGIGSILFGLGADMLGMAVGIALITGINAALGTLLPLVFLQQRTPSSTSLLALGGAVILLLAGIITLSMAAKAKEKASAAADTGAKPRKFLVGFLVCVAAGIFCPMMNFSVFFGKPLTDLTQNIVTGYKATYPLLALALLGGSLAQIVYCVYLFRRNHSAGLFAARDTRNWVMGIIMAVLWYGGMLLYALASNVYLGEIGPVIGWPLFLSMTILVANILGSLTKEWTGAPMRARMLRYVAIALLIAAVAFVGLANHYLSM